VLKLSNNASAGFVKALGDLAHGTVVSQVLPSERGLGMPLVKAASYLCARRGTGTALASAPHPLLQEVLMTAWPLNCTAASAAEDVLWRRGGAATHRLLIDTPAVPLRFNDASEPPTPNAAAIGREAATELVHRTVQMLRVWELKPR
jgi:hypothetical protein